MSKQNKLNNLAVDFQPDAVEIAMRPVPFMAKLGVWIGVVFFFGSLIASYFCEVDVIVTGTGKLVPVDQNIVMKPLDRTVIRSIEVKVGDVVRKGQVLITFDPAINQAEKKRLTSEYLRVKAQLDRFKAEYEGAEYTPVPHWQCNDCEALFAGETAPESCNYCQRETRFTAYTDENDNGGRQLALFNSRREYYASKLRHFEASIQRIRTEQASSREQLAQQRLRLEEMRKLVDMQRALVEKNAGTQIDLSQYIMSFQQQEGEISRLEGSIAANDREIEAIEEQKNEFINEWRKDITENLVSAEQALITIRTSLDKILQLDRYIQLEAPCDAIVLEIASFPVGSAVREAEALITLVPISEIEVEAEIPAQDIGKVKVGDTVRVKLNAFPFQKHGTLDGVIREISPDSFQKQPGQGGGDPSATGGSYYRVWITLSGTLRNVPDNFRLTPGMEVQAEIKVGTRSVLEYIIHPLVKSLDEAIREP